MIYVAPPVRETADREVRLVTTVELPTGPAPLWFAVDRAHADSLTPDRLDPFLLGLLPLAMQLGHDLHLAGSLSEQLYLHTTRHLMTVVNLIYPHWKPVKIRPDRLDSAVLAGRHDGVATGLSGGIDSFAVIADHLGPAAPAGFRLTHLLFHNVGSHGRGEAGRALFRQRAARHAPLAAEWGLPFVMVDSNLHEVLRAANTRPPQHYAASHSLRNAAAALVLQPLHRRYLYASAFPYPTCYVGPAKTIGYSDPYVVPLLSTENTAVIATGGQFTRPEKTARITALPASRQFLDVCRHVAPPGAPANCSRCQKCLRTLLTLELLDQLEDYRQVFDLAAYRQHRRGYWLRTLVSRDPFAREIRAFAAARGRPLWRYAWQGNAARKSA